MGVFVATTTAISSRMIGTDFTDSLTVACFNDAATQVDDDIRGKLSKRYDISAAYFQTSTSAPPMLQAIGKTLCIGYMYESLSRSGKEAMSRSEKLIKRAMSALDDIANRKVHLLDSTGSLITVSSSSHPGVKDATGDYSTTFNEDHPLNWAVDLDKLDAIDSERD
jgi:hypothetical protein